MTGFWCLYRLRNRAKRKMIRDILTFFFNRSARRHGGYVGPGAVILGEPLLPHGLHGVYISRFATIGAGCRIYQNVTIGEVKRRARCGKWVSHRSGCSAGGGYPHRRRSKDRRQERWCVRMFRRDAP